MRVLANHLSRSAQTAGVALAALFALAVLGGVLAHWTWRWFAPAPRPAAPDAAIAVDPGVAAGLFGSAAADLAAPTATAVGIRLFGVVQAGDGGTGYAVLQLDGQRVVAVREGGDIAPGLRLVEISARSVVLDRAGVRESLVLPKIVATVPPTPP